MTNTQNISKLATLSIEIEAARLQRDMYLCGTLLIQAKGLLRHGEWTDWLQNNSKIPERTAREYMKLARSPREYKVARTASQNATSKKTTLSPGMIVTVRGKQTPNSGQSVEVIEVKKSIVICKAYDSSDLTPYLPGELVF